jgi:uncharacterized protein YvpB
MQKKLPDSARIAFIAVCMVLLAGGVLAVIKQFITPEEAKPVMGSASIIAPAATVTAETVTETVTEATLPEVLIKTPEENILTSPSAEDTTRIIYTHKSYDGNSVYLDMENILQLPELPTGCEITALTILLRHYGFDAEKTDLARNYLPVSWGNYRLDEDGNVCKDSFFEYFIGDPFGTGYGCFAPAIVTAAEKYIADHGGGYEVVDISGCEPQDLYNLLIEGTPVITWATDGMIPPEYYESWLDNATGEQLDWYLNEHAFVLAGFDINAGLVTVNDPMKGIIVYNKQRFETRFAEMHSQAVYLKKLENADISALYNTETTANVET